MLRKISGHKCGFNQNLLITTYKVLIRSVLDSFSLRSYSISPIQTLLVCDTKAKKLESIQNQALRLACRWPSNQSNNSMLSHLKIDTLKTRHNLLLKNYLNKAATANPAISEELVNYNLSAGHQEGMYCNIQKRKRETIFSKITKPLL